MKWFGIFLVLIALPVHATKTRPTGMSECLPYDPSPSDLAEIRNASDIQIPETATLTGACSYTWAKLEPPVTMRESRHYQYQFIWVREGSIDGLLLIEKASCSREEEMVPTCTHWGTYARYNNRELIGFSKNINPLELKELMDQLQRLPVPEAPVRSVEKTYTGHSGTWRIGKRVYQVEFYDRGERSTYFVERNCQSYAECDWRIEKHSISWSGMPQ